MSSLTGSLGDSLGSTVSLTTTTTTSHLDPFATTNHAFTSNNLSLAFQNVNSILNQHIRADLLTQHIHTNDFDFFGIVETWVPTYRKLESCLDSLDKNKFCLYSDHTNDKSHRYFGNGTALIVKRTLTPFVQEIFRLPGRATCLLLRCRQLAYLIGTVYHPANIKDKSEISRLASFLSKTFANLPSGTKIVLGGDWNTTLGPLDRMAYQVHNSVKKPLTTTLRRHGSKISRLLARSAFQMQDIWRLHHPDKVEYTNVQKWLDQASNRTVCTSSRIDLIMVSLNGTALIPTSTISDPFDTQLRHKQVSISANFPLDKLAFHSLRHVERSISYQFHDASPEALQSYKTFVNDEISKLPQSLTCLDARLRRFTTIAIRASKKFIPFRRFIKQSGVFVSCSPVKSSRRRLTSRISKFLNSSKLHSKSSKRKLNRLYKEWFRSSTPRSPSGASAIAKAAELKEDVECWLRKHKQDKLKSRLDQIRQTTIRTVSNFLNSALERSNDFKGLYFLQDKVSLQFRSEPEYLKEQIRIHFDSIFGDPFPEIDLTGSVWGQSFQPLPNARTLMKPVAQPITKDELLQYLKALKNHKAVGPDQLSYEHLKHLTDGQSLDYLLGCLNQSLMEGTLPDDLNRGKVILLSKLAVFNGDPNKLRPITLLSAIRKVLTGLLAKRITNVLTKHQLLKGFNTGFMPGQSTNDNITFMRLIIDDCVKRKSCLLVGSLDVEKAYDSVPLKAQEMALTRVGVPPQIVSLIMNLQRTRSITIQTPYGESASILPERGLPQGDPLSCILWNLFYDPLLCELQNKTAGCNIGDMNVPCMAFADDLTLLASSIPAMQTQLDLVQSFLSTFHINANASKSQIITNLDTTTVCLYLGKDMISNVVDSKTSFRLLGVHLSLDGSHKNTIQMAISELQTLIGRLNSKFLTSTLAVYIANAVLLPILLYRLQVAVVRPRVCDQLQVFLNKFTRQKCNLDTSLPNVFLWDRAFYGLGNVAARITSMQLANLQVHLLGSNYTSKAVRAVSQQITSAKKLPENIFVCPVYQSPRTRTIPYLQWLSGQMFNMCLQFRLPIHHRAGQIAQHLSASEYQEHAKHLNSLKLTNISQVTVQHTGQPARLNSYDEFFESLTGPQINREMRLYDGIFTPEYYKAALGPFCDWTEQTLLSNPNFKPILVSPSSESYQPPDLTIPDNSDVTIFTDGSLKDTRVAAAAILLPSDSVTALPYGQLGYRCVSTNASSTKGEIHAILLALKACPSSCRVHVFTDSQASISAISKIAESSTPSRQLLKLANYYTLRLLQHRLSRFTTPPTFQHVKAHNNNFWNDQADLLAKRSLSRIIDFPFSPEPTELNNREFILLHHHGSSVEQYPTHFLKKTFQKQLERETNRYIEKQHPNLDLNFRLCRELARFRPKQMDVLDASNAVHLKFRSKLLSGSLSVKINMAKRQIIQDDKCPRCKRYPETIDHLWTCQETASKMDAIKAKFISVLRSRFQSNYGNLSDTEIHYLVHPLPFLSSPPTELHQPIFKGLITNELWTRVRQLWIVGDPSVSKRERLLQIIDSWMIAFVETIWIDRNNILYSTPPAPAPTNSTNPPIILRLKIPPGMSSQPTKPPIKIRLKIPLSLRNTTNSHLPTISTSASTL